MLAYFYLINSYFLTINFLKQGFILFYRDNFYPTNHKIKNYSLLSIGQTFSSIQSKNDWTFEYTPGFSSPQYFDPNEVIPTTNRVVNVELPRVLVRTRPLPESP